MQLLTFSQNVFDLSIQSHTVYHVEGETSHQRSKQCHPYFLRSGRLQPAWSETLLTGFCSSPCLKVIRLGKDKLLGLGNHPALITLSQLLNEGRRVLIKLLEIGQNKHITYLLFNYSPEWRWLLYFKNIFAYMCFTILFRN